MRSITALSLSLLATKALATPFASETKGNTSMVSVTPAAPTSTEVVVERRQFVAIAAGIAAALSIGTSLSSKIKEDKADRSEFTQTLLDNLFEADPYKNYVIVHTKHEVQWNGAEGKDWQQKHTEFDIKIGGTIGYDVYISQKGGTFTLKGDGGYLNWAYKGYVDGDKTDTKKKKYVFKDAPTPPADATYVSASVPTTAGEGYQVTDIPVIVPVIGGLGKGGKKGDKTDKNDDGDDGPTTTKKDDEKTTTSKASEPSTTGGNGAAPAATNDRQTTDKDSTSSRSHSSTASSASPSATSGCNKPRKGYSITVNPSVFKESALQALLKKENDPCNTVDYHHQANPKQFYIATLTAATKLKVASLAGVKSVDEDKEYNEAEDGGAGLFD